MGFLDVMLRFGCRHPDIERQLAERGYEIVIPRRRTGARDDSHFTIRLTAGAGFTDLGALVEQVGKDLLSLGPVLRGLAGAADRVVAELDVGIPVDPDVAVRHCRFPPAFLATVSELGLELCVSIYYP